MRSIFRSEDLHGVYTLTTPASSSNPTAFSAAKVSAADFSPIPTLPSVSTSRYHRLLIDQKFVEGGGCLELQSCLILMGSKVD